jgi:hypothetical protein
VKTKPKKITVALKDLVRVCHACGEVKNDVREREYYTKNYQGRCGDSFCYASCTMNACNPIRARVCNACEKAKRAPERTE